MTAFGGRQHPKPLAVEWQADGVHGPALDYAALTTVVNGRTGFGPVWIAWDTNILSIYGEYGLSLWSGDVPAIRGHDPDQVDALGDLIAIWMWWDLRFIVLNATSSDAKRRPTEDVADRRTRAAGGLAEALALGVDGNETVPDRRSSRFPGAVTQVLPKGHDQLIVNEAFALGSDVLLTMDKGVLKADTLLQEHGMRCLSPCGLVDELVSAGVVATWSPTQLGGLAPDLGRMAALIGALDPD